MLDFVCKCLITIHTRLIYREETTYPIRRDVVSQCHSEASAEESNILTHLKREDAYAVKNLYRYLIALVLFFFPVPPLTASLTARA